jgi:hypothetical protein
VTRALIGVGSRWPAVFSGGAAHALADGVRVADGAVYEGNLRVADLPQVVQRTPREDVSEIRVAGKRKGNKLMAAVGAGGGFLLGLTFAGALAFKECGSSCSDEEFLAWLSVIGLPVGLGLLGYYGGGSTVGGLVYRAPAPPVPDAPRGSNARHGAAQSSRPITRRGSRPPRTTSRHLSIPAASGPAQSRCRASQGTDSRL